MKKRRKLKLKFKILFLILIAFYVYRITLPYIKDFTNTENKTTINNSLKKSNTIDSVVMNHSDDNLTIEERLKKIEQEDSRVNQIIENYDDYPEQLLDMLSRNIEMVDYVMNFLNEKGNTYSNDIGQMQD